MRLPAVLLLAALAVPAHAAPRPFEAQAATSDATRLVALIASEASVVQLARQLFDAYLRDEANLPAEMAALFAKDPALKTHVAARLRGEMVAIMRGELPALRAQLATLVHSEMTAAETADTLTFLSSATGRKLLASAYRGLGEAGVMSEAEAEQAATAAIMRDLEPEDYSTLLTFGSTTAAKKFQTLRPRISETSRRWGEEVAARQQSRLERAFAAAVADYRRGR